MIKMSAGIKPIDLTTYARQGLGFYTGDNADTTTDAQLRMSILRNGNVGIGTTTPTAKLYVDGSIRSSETKYWSCSGLHFDSISPATINVTKAAAGYIAALATTSFRANVNLPNRAKVSSVEVFGNAGASDTAWTLQRIELSDATYDVMATANINTADSTISNATVDNLTYGYLFFTGDCLNGDKIYGARITYTL